MKFRSTTFKSLGSEVAIVMSFDLFDLAGFIGVLLIVIAYLLLQLDKLPSSSLSFSLLNASGFVADHVFPCLQVQRVGVLDRGLLVFDQLARPNEMADGEKTTTD